ncbi:hypothetical protein [Pendulispora albinea]|uniref:Uncharacterized protein n=1 Tax=Pendulispora albinea TaxID=2741071 RepID=A0ABZ2M1Y0_9BACT
MSIEMNKREEDEQQIDTVPPPPGEEDAYSAETRIGKIPSDLLQAMKRAHASEATSSRVPEESGKVDRPPMSAVAAAVSAALKTPPSHLGSLQDRPTVPRVTPTIPPPAELLPSPSVVPLNEPPRASDFPMADGVERDSEDADYVRTMLMFQGSPLPGTTASGLPVPTSAPFYLPKVDVNLTPELAALASPGSASSSSSSPSSSSSSSSGSSGSSPALTPAVSVAPVLAAAPISSVASGYDSAGYDSAGHDSAGASSSSRTSASGSTGHPVPPPEVLEMVDQAKVDEGRMSFAPFMTQESRRLNILLGVGIGFFLILMIIVLASAK